MTILYLHQYFKTPKDAGGTRSYEMARRFVEAGHRVIMITSDMEADEAGDWYYSEVEGIEILWLPVPYNNKMSYSDRIKAFFRFALKAGKKASSFDADVIFATSTPLTIAIPAIQVKKKLRIPMVFEVRDLWPEVPISLGAIKNPLLKFLAKSLEKAAYKNASHIVALSIDMKKGILNDYNYNDSDISVIPNSSDNKMFEDVKSDFRENHPWLKDRPMVLYAGTLGKVNGVGYFVEVAKEMLNINKDICFVIVGDGVEKNEIQSKAKEEGVLNINLYLIDPVPKKDLPNIYAATDVASSVVIDNESLWANSANKFFDTLAAGKPIVINHGGWQKDVIENYNAGIVLSPINYEQAANDLNDLLTNSEQLNEMGLNAKNLAKEKFDRDKLAQELLNVLEKAANA